MPSGSVKTVVFTEFSPFFFDYFARLLDRPELDICRVVFSKHTAEQLRAFYHRESLHDRLVRLRKLIRYRDLNRARALRFLMRYRDRMDYFENARTFEPIACDYLCSLGFMRRIPAEQIAVSATSSNLHWSLLPDYAGCAPGYWALREHQTVGGVTLHAIAEGFDDGPILLQHRLPIDAADTIDDLSPRYRAVSGPLLAAFLTHRERYTHRARRQDRGAYRFFKSPTRDDRRLDQACDARDAWGRYRAAGPGRCYVERDGVLRPVAEAKPPAKQEDCAGDWENVAGLQVRLAEAA